MTSLVFRRLDKLILDPRTQQRVEMDAEQVESIAESVRTWMEAESPGPWPLPEVDVFRDPRTKAEVLAHGFHRYRGTEAAGYPEIAVKVHAGTLRDAILFSVACNAIVARKPEDIRKAIFTVLDDREWRTWSTAEIARRCRVKWETAAKYRAEWDDAHLSTRGSEERTYTTKHGTVTTMSTGNIGQREMDYARLAPNLIPEFQEGLRQGLLSVQQAELYASLAPEEQGELLVDGEEDEDTKTTGRAARAAIKFAGKAIAALEPLGKRGRKAEAWWRRGIEAVQALA